MEVQQELKIIKGRFTGHINIIADLVTRKSLQLFIQHIEVLREVTTLVHAGNGKMHILLKTRHRIKTCTKSHPLSDISRNINSYTSSSTRQGQIKMTKRTVLSIGHERKA